MRSRLITSAATHLVGLVIAAAAASNFATSYFNFLSVLLYLLIPWSAINLVDYYLVRDGDYAVNEFFSRDGGRYGRWNWGALSVFAFGVVAQIPFMVTDVFVGPIAVAMGEVDLAWIAGLVVSGAGFFLLAKFAPRAVRVEQ